MSDTNTAAVPAAPVATVTLSNGEVLTSAMTPLERHNAVAKSLGAPAVERPSVNLFPVSGLTDATVAELARHDAKSPPPSNPSAPPKSVALSATVQDPAAKLAEFDAQMRAAGKQIVTPEHEEAFRAASVKWLEDWANKQPDDWQRQNEPQMQKWATEIEAGRASVRLNEATGAVELHTRNAPAAQPRSPNGTFAPASEAAMNAALDAAKKASNKYGFAPHTAITGPLAFGYKIPPGEWHVAELVAGLQLARAGNLSQAQLDAILAKGGV